jgi:GNAT superfamily N-acetyltransferase
MERVDLAVHASFGCITVSWRDPENLLCRGTVDLSTFEEGEWWVNRALVQGPNTRGRGMGSRLLQTALREAVVQGARRVLVTPGGYGENPESQARFYIKNGFAVTETEGLYAWVKPEDAV